MFTLVSDSRAVVASEATATYDHSAELADAVEAVETAIDILGRIGLEAEGDRELLGAAVHLARQASRLAAQQLRVLEQIDRRAAYSHEGAVTAASWYRGHTRLAHGEAARQVNAAVRLRRLPRLREALENGDVAFSHVTAVTDAAVPRRMDAIADCEEPLVNLALTTSPWQVRQAMKTIADHTDQDGSEAPPITDSGPDERRDLSLRRSIDGLWDVSGTLDPLAGERLATVVDAFDTPDPADTPPELKRSAGQRRADALDAAVTRVLDSGDVPLVQGNKAHVLATMDLATLLGRDDLAARAPRMRYTGEITPALARQLALGAKLTVVLTMGPWRVVNVGRTFRTLPPWLRTILEAIHRHCRGPHCDRRISWSQAHHELAWDDGGETDLNRTIPLCKAHHDMVTTGQWTVSYNPDTGVCTWTGPDNQVITTPPPDP